MEFKPLVWSEPLRSTEEVRYNHVIAETPFGRFLITWKGWKEHDSPTIDETPWGDFGGVGCDVEDAKAIAEKAYLERLAQCVN